MPVNELIGRIRTSTQHKYLYHFTDQSSLRSIDKWGLLSKIELKSRDLWPDRTGGDELSDSLDAHRGIDHYVSLCMTLNHPMEFIVVKNERLPESIYLKIDPTILITPGVKMAFGIANGNDTKILPIDEAIAEFDFEVLYERTKWSDPDVNRRLRLVEKYEVLIPDCVPRSKI